MPLLARAVGQQLESAGKPILSDMLVRCRDEFGIEQPIGLGLLLASQIAGLLGLPGAPNGQLLLVTFSGVRVFRPLPQRQ